MPEKNPPAHDKTWVKWMIYRQQEECSTKRPVRSSEGNDVTQSDDLNVA